MAHKFHRTGRSSLPYYTLQDCFTLCDTQGIPNLAAVEFVENFVTQGTGRCSEYLGVGSGLGSLTAGRHRATKGT